LVWIVPVEEEEKERCCRVCWFVFVCVREICACTFRVESEKSAWNWMRPKPGTNLAIGVTGTDSTHALVDTIKELHPADERSRTPAEAPALSLAIPASFRFYGVTARTIGKKPRSCEAIPLQVPRA
jgi:hypothetical protein